LKAEAFENGTTGRARIDDEVSGAERLRVAGARGNQSAVAAAPAERLARAARRRSPA
jgi:hypothetical protein